MQNRPDHYLSKELLDVRRTLGWMDLVIGSIVDGVYVVDKDSRLVFVNQYFSDLLGVHRVFILGQKLDDVFKARRMDAPPPEYIGVATSTDAGEGSVALYEWGNLDGITMVFKISSRLLRATGQTVYLAQDITQEFEASQMKSRFMDLASHQLRTPNTAIMTYSHMLNDGYAGPLSKEQRLLTETIIASSERMNQLVNRLLKITRIQNAAVDSRVDSVPLGELLEGIRKEFVPRTKQKQIRLRLKLPDDELTITSDATALKEIFSNLIDNAVRYTPEAGSVTIEARSLKNYISVSVRDSGIGIPQGQFPLLFKQFSRADNALETNPDGTGLGLYMIRLLLERIGGTIKVRSDLGKGSTFTVGLPRR